MVEAVMTELVGQIKTFLEKWSPGNQVECIDLMIATWAANSWGIDELTLCETQVEAALTPADGTISATIE